MAKNLRGKRILYLVYNTQARKDAEVKFKRAGLTWVDVRTTSQLAWRAYADTHKDRMRIDAPAVPAKDVAKALDLRPQDFGDKLVLDGFTQARLAADTIERFCNSDHIRITEKRSEEQRLNSSHVKISYAVFCLKKKTRTPSCVR